MNKVYMISSGSYSDYAVNRCFSTKELAEEWIGIFKENSDYFIEERNLDDMSDKLQPLSGEMIMNFHTGEVWSNIPSHYSTVGRGYASIITVTYYPWKNITLMSMYFDYHDVEKMTKIMGEKRAHIKYNISTFYPHLIKENPQQIKFNRETCLLVKD